MVAYSLFVNTPCCTEVTWNSGAWWSPRLLGVLRGGGGEGEVSSSGHWHYKLSAECQPATAREKGEGAGIFADSVTDRCRTWPSRDLAQVYQVTTFGSLNTSVSRIPSSRNIAFFFKSPLIFCILWQGITKSRFNLKTMECIVIF